MANNIIIPKILLTNQSNKKRLSHLDWIAWNEIIVQREVLTFLYTLGFEIDLSESLNNNYLAKKYNTYIHFHYSESIKKTFKSFRIWNSYRKANIRTLKNIVEKYNQSSPRNNEVLDLDFWIDGNKPTRTIIYGNSCLRFKKLIKN
jgi:hypothetical protein